MQLAIAKLAPRILLPFLLLLFFAAIAVARVNCEPLSDEESTQILQQIERGETPEAVVLVRALASPQMKLRARAAELLGNVQVGSIDEWYALEPLIACLRNDRSSLEGAAYPDPGMSTPRWWAHASLQRISGEDFGYRWDDPSPINRLAAIDRWMEWGRRRSIDLLLAHPDFELPPLINKERYLEGLKSAPGNDIPRLTAFLGRARVSSIWEKTALGTIALAAVLLAGAPWLASDRRRVLLLFVLAAMLGLSGYAYFDREYLAALVHLRDDQLIREDGARVLRMSRTMGGLGLMPGDVAFPNSFYALRIGSVVADDHTVALEWIDSRGKWAYYRYLYDPEGLRASARLTLGRARPTFRKGIYLYEPYGG